MPGTYASRLRNTINVAFEGPTTGNTFEEGEELPMPGHNNGSVIHEEGPVFQDDGYEMAGPGFNEAGGSCSDGMCYGEAGYGSGEGCGDGCGMTCGDGVCGCEPDCGCGGTCEPGCGCEPDCGCASGQCGGSGGFCRIGLGDPEATHTVCIDIPKVHELTLFAGVQGFKGPYDRDRDSGNFGFHDGLNAGFKVPWTDVGYQLGYQVVHSQLNGDKDTNISDPHTQQFATAGLFRRTRNGLQGGVVWDMLRDERWGAVDFHQLRTELSFMDRGCHEFGFAGAFHLSEYETRQAVVDDQTFTTLWQATDQYLLFYRLHGKRGGEGRFFGGFNDDGDGIIGADVLMPIHNRWSIQTGFTYLIPEADAGTEGASQEAWNIGLGLVWHWGCRGARQSYCSPYRPLFNVADNGSLIIDDRLGMEVHGGG